MRADHGHKPGRGASAGKASETPHERFDMTGWRSFRCSAARILATRLRPNQRTA
jgi:hypothetical protein